MSALSKRPLEISEETVSPMVILSLVSVPSSMRSTEALLPVLFMIVTSTLDSVPPIEMSPSLIPSANVFGTTSSP